MDCEVVVVGGDENGKEKESEESVGDQKGIG